MARLTRTQKYADLRNQLENGREVEIRDENISKSEEYKHEEVIPTVVEEVTPSVEVIEPIKEETKVEVEEVEEPVTEETPVAESANDDFIDIEELFKAADTEFDFEPITLDEPVAEEPKVEEPIISEPIKIEAEPIVETEEHETCTCTCEEESSTCECEEPCSCETESSIEESTIAEPTVEDPIVIEPIVEPIEVAPVAEEPEIEDLTNNYLEECLNEVNEYNKSKGLMTDDEIPTTILNEIRGTVAEPAKPATEDVKVEDLKIEDEDFTNTVTLEIKKILSELENDDSESVDTVTAEPVVSTPVAEEKLVQAQVDPAEETTEEDVAEILKSYLNDEDGDEDLAKTMTVGKIEEVPSETEKPLAEEATIQATLLSEQIPLEVVKDTNTPVETSEEDEDEEEVEGPNRILNFVLIALIVVLLFVLGFIGYMILVAQGII